MGDAIQLKWATLVQLEGDGTATRHSRTLGTRNQPLSLTRNLITPRGPAEFPQILMDPADLRKRKRPVSFVAWSDSESSEDDLRRSTVALRAHGRAEQQSDPHQSNRRRLRTT